MVVEEERSAESWGRGGEGDSEAVYVVRRAVLSRSFVEPHTRDRPKQPDEPAPRHAPRNGSRRSFLSLVFNFIGQIPHADLALSSPWAYSFI